MGIYNAAGARLANKAAVTSTAVADPEIKLTMDLFETKAAGRGDAVVEGSIKVVAARSGEVVRQSFIDALFSSGSVSSISPVNGAAAGGTVVTLRGTRLDGTTSVTFGGTAGTALTVVSSTEVRVTTPAKAAGTHAVGIVDDGTTLATPHVFTTA